MVYRGPNDGQGVKVYKNRQFAKGQTQWSDDSSSDGSSHVDYDDSGELMIGRIYQKPNWKYTKCKVDELLIWNKELVYYDIGKVYNGF